MNFPVLLFIFFVCPKKTNQQRSGERKGSQSLAASLLIRNMRITLRCSQRATLRKVAVAPPNRFSALCCAAQLREMAFCPYMNLRFFIFIN